MTLKTSYEQKFIGDVDPGSAMLDIIESLTYMGTRDTRFVFNGNSSIISDSKDDNNTQIFTNTEEDIFNQLSNLDKKKSVIIPIEKEFKKNPILANKKKKKALVITKKSDEIIRKPLFLEPLFTKVEIMPYVSKNGLYHEQQSIWLKVKKGEIVIKSNPNGFTTPDSYKTILDK
jgi:hypothetical protein